VVFGTTILGSNPSAPAKNMNIFYELKKLLFPFYKSKNIKYIVKTKNEGQEKPQAMYVGGCVRK